MNLVSRAQKAVDVLKELNGEPSFSEYLVSQINRTVACLETDIIDEQTYGVHRATLEEKKKFTVENAKITSIKSGGANFSGRHVSWLSVIIIDPKYGKVSFNTTQSWVYSASRDDVITGTLKVKSVKPGFVSAKCSHKDMILTHDSGRGVLFETNAS